MSRSSNQKSTVGFTSKEIVSDIKTNLKTHDHLYLQYLEDHALTSIDPVKDSEYLKAGWSKNVIVDDEISRFVDDKFSFLIDMTRAHWLVITASVIGEDLYLHPPTLSLRFNDDEIGKMKLRHSVYHHYYFKIKKDFRRVGVINATLQRSDKKTKVIIRMIAAYVDISRGDWDITLNELSVMKRDANQLLRVLDWNKNPEYLMPADQRAKLLKKIILRLLHPISDSTLIKKIVLRVIRPFTTPQMEFNKYLVDLLNLQSMRLDKLENFIMLMIKNKKKNG